jgi:hypothetical protein
MPWCRRAREARREALAAAERADRLEREAARRRIIEAAMGNDHQAMWNGPTRTLLIAPLLTRGQVARSHQAHWW